MAIVYNSRIVTDGLTLALDSGNAKSYPESGTTWNDLSGNGNHGTLVAFTGASGGTTSGYDTNTGHMMFDRHVGGGDGTANNRVTVPTSTSLQQCLSSNGVTIEMWLKVTTTVCTATTRWSGPWELYYCPNLVHRTIGTGGSDGTNTGGITSSTNLNKFHHIVATHSGLTRTLYVNGINVLTDTNPMSGQDVTATLGIGAYADGTYAFVGALPIYRLYSRALSPVEILQNFNASRSRFGV